MPIQYTVLYDVLYIVDVIVGLIYINLVEKVWMPFAIDPKA